MSKATQYVDYLYSLYEGRAAVTVGVDNEFKSIHPFVFENNSRMPIGLIAMSAGNVSDPDDVDLYHISAFMPGKGQGSEIMHFLCKVADEFGVRLCLQAEVQFSGKQSMTTIDLICWYRKFGFEGNDIMHREPE